MNTYCWIHGTFTLADYLTPNTTLDNIPHQGVGVELKGKTYTKIYHYYYQWIPFVLLFGMTMFYIPRFIWKNVFEGSRMKALCNESKVRQFWFKDIQIVLSLSKYMRIFRALTILSFRSGWFPRHPGYVVNLDNCCDKISTAATNLQFINLSRQLRFCRGSHADLLHI